MIYDAHPQRGPYIGAANPPQIFLLSIIYNAFVILHSVVMKAPACPRIKGNFYLCTRAILAFDFPDATSD